MSDAPEDFQHGISRTIRDHALTLPETTEGTSCVNRAFKVGSKNFAFLGEKDGECNLRLKLGPSIPDVQSLSERHPASFEVGKFGWTMLRFPPDDPPPVEDLERWITESFALFASARVRALLDT